MNRLHDFWFDNEEVWFDATPADDTLIKNRFSHLIKDKMSFSELDDIFQYSSQKAVLAYILLYDQVIRHIYCNDKEKIKFFSIRALYLSVKLFDKNKDWDYMPKERIFILMPFRHTFFTKFIKLAIERVKEYMDNSYSPYYQRFYRSSLLSLATVEPEEIGVEPLFNEIKKKEILEALDDDSSKQIDNICEKVNHTEPIFRVFKETLRQLGNPDNVTLSLSGGVDSMVCCFVLYHLSEKRKKFKITAVNIDYGNRDESPIETEFVKKWCYELNIPLYVRHITAIKRDRSDNRDLYEKVTKEMRFAMYKKFNYPVILGHNLDDCLENIINNIKKVRSYDNLKGMRFIMSDNGCTIVRPLLKISKQEIMEFAKEYRIPHLANSTPCWSERGQIREVLLPFLNEFDSRIVPGLIKLADNTKNMYEIYHGSVIEDFYNKNVEIGSDHIRIELRENAREKQYDFIFWKDIMFKIFNKLNWNLPSNLALTNMTERIQRDQYGLIQLNKHLRMRYSEQDLLIKL